MNSPDLFEMRATSVTKSAGIDDRREEKQQRVPTVSFSKEFFALIAALNYRVVIFMCVFNTVSNAQCSTGVFVIEFEK